VATATKIPHKPSMRETPFVPRAAVKLRPVAVVVADIASQHGRVCAAKIGSRGQATASFEVGAKPTGTKP